MIDINFFLGKIILDVKRIFLDNKLSNSIRDTLLVMY